MIYLSFIKTLRFIMTFKTRFAPSPTGEMHFGNVRTALFNSLAALGNNGSFLLRVEDTDEERSTGEFEQLLYTDLQWLGIYWQEGPLHLGQVGTNGPYKQSERKEIYKGYYEQLLANNQAYYCFCTEEQLALSRKLQRSQHLPPRYTGTCSNLSKDEVQKRISNGEQPAIRFRIPKNQTIEFNDLVKGPQSFKSDDIGDFIIIRGCGTSSFMFCNAIDDALMGVTHALRGEDHLTNTPRQLMIAQTLGLKHPEYGHISLIVGADGSPLSKRHGSKSIKALREEGYLPEAIINYLARLGHQYENLKFSDIKTLGQKFSLTSLGKSPAHYDEQHLHYWQKEAVLNIDANHFAVWLNNHDQSKDGVTLCAKEHKEDFLKLMQENIVFPQEVFEWSQILFTDNKSYTEEQISLFNTTSKDFFIEASKYLNNIKHDSGFDIKLLCNHLKEKFNLNGKKLFEPIRVCLTMSENGPELVKIVKLMGLERVKQRFEKVSGLL